jgi:hypothetical protein
MTKTVSLKEFFKQTGTVQKAHAELMRRGLDTTLQSVYRWKWAIEGKENGAMPDNANRQLLEKVAGIKVE